jgi:hypothetical protein
MESKYYIWNIELKAWWRKESWGYTKDIANAELYTRADAEFICTNRNGFIKPPVVEMIAETDLNNIREKINIHFQKD